MKIGDIYFCMMDNFVEYVQIVKFLENNKVLCIVLHHDTNGADVHNAKSNYAITLRIQNKSLICDKKGYIFNFLKHSKVYCGYQYIKKVC